MRKADVLDLPSVVSVKEQYDANGIPFEPALNDLLDQHGANGVTKEVVDVVVSCLWQKLTTYLANKKAETTAGKVIRAVVNFISFGTLMKKKKV
jgi:hypothetical protein